jgi:hypothetical protein
MEGTRSASQITTGTSQSVVTGGICQDKALWEIIGLFRAPATLWPIAGGTYSTSDIRLCQGKRHCGLRILSRSDPQILAAPHPLSGSRDGSSPSSRRRLLGRRAGGAVVLLVHSQRKSVFSLASSRATGSRHAGAFIFVPQFPASSYSTWRGFRGESQLKSLR